MSKSFPLRRLLPLALAAALCLTPAWAQPGPASPTPSPRAMPAGQVLTLEQALATAYERSPLLAAALQGHDIGLLSEAGMPAVADPGSSVVRAAHELGIAVQPLVGPVSLLLALAASMVGLWAATQKLPVGTAYAIWTGVGAVGAAVVGVVVFPAATAGGTLLARQLLDEPT